MRLSHRALSDRNLPWWTWIVPLLVCHLGTRLSVHFKTAPGTAVWYLPIALAIAMIHWWGPRVLPGLYINAVLSAGLWDLQRRALWPVYGLPETLTVFLSWLFFTRLAKGKCWLPDIDETLRFILLGIILPATIGNFYLHVQFTLLGDLSTEQFWEFLFSNLISDYLGGLTITIPLLLLLTPVMERHKLSKSQGATIDASMFLKDISVNRFAEIAAVFGGLFVLSLTVPLEDYWFVYGILVLWAALRLSVELAVLASTWTTFLTLLLPAMIPGTFGATWTSDAHLTNIHLGLGIIGVTGLLVSRAINDVSENEERLRAIANASPDPIFILDEDGRYLEVLTAYSELLYAEIEDLKGKRVCELLPEPQAALITDCIQRTLDTGVSQSIEYKLNVIKGEQWFEARTAPLNLVSAGKRTILFTARDVTERKRAEETIRRLGAAVEQSTEGFIITNMQGQIIYTNPTIETLYGYTSDELRGKSAFILNADSAATNTMGQEFAEKGFWSGEVAQRRKDGSIFPALLSLFTVKEKDSDLDSAVALVRDITEHKLMDEALRESEERYRRLVELSPDMIAVHQGGEILFINRAGAQILGASSPEEIVGRPLQDFVSPERRTLSRQRIRKLLQTGENSVTYEQKIMRINGQERDIEVVGTLFSHKGAMAIQFIARDITERKRAEAERTRLTAQIEEHARQVQQIIDTVPEGVLLLNADRQIISANPVARQHLLILTGAKIGDELAYVGTRPLEEFLTSHPDGLWHEIEIVDDTPRYFELIARSIKTGPPAGGWVLVIRDVTQEKETQRHLQQQNRLAAVGQMAAGIAHDFNNIMAVITLYAQIVQKITELPPKAQDRLETISQQAHRATNLIEQILDFSRQSMLRRQALDLVPFVKEQVKLLERTLPEHIKIHFSYGKDTYVVNADPTRIQQAIMNLAVNARDAMLEGGELHIEIERVRSENKSSPLPGMAPGDWVQISVSDTGAGIPPNVLSHIFEPFFTTKAPRGAGLGLSQVYGIVKQHDGHVDVKTQTGKGTTFILYLPVLSMPIEDEQTRQTQQALIAGAGQTILMVEDDAATREALVDSIELIGYQTLTAENGRQALTIWEQYSEEIALVLSDVVMPEMGGIDLFHTLKQRDASVKMALLTGHLLEGQLSGQLERLKEQGLVGWLQKPPDLEQLAQFMAEALKD